MYKFLLFAVFPLIAQMPTVDFSEGKKIAFQNSILAKVNGTAISMLDVKKRMDMLFHQYYSNLSHSSTARYQFYEKSWRPILMEMIDNELILADAEEKEVKITDADIRETMETRFGPNVLSTLDQIGFTYDEAWKLLKKELTVQRMTWWFIHSKAIQSVTPQLIRSAYKGFLEEHPPYQELKYHIVSIRSENMEIADKVYKLLVASGKSPETLTATLLEMDPSIQVSSEYCASDLEISESHKSALFPLESGSYSIPILQKSRVDNKSITRIFYLSSKTDHPAPSFQELSPSLRDQLIQKAMAQHSQTYVDKLRSHFGFDTSFLKESLPEDLQPFSLQ